MNSNKRFIAIRGPLEKYKQPAFWSFRTSSPSNDQGGSNSPLIKHPYHNFRVSLSYNGPLLPPELWLQVLELLQWSDLLTLTKVTSQFRNMALPLLWHTVILCIKRVTVKPMPCAPHLYGFIRHFTISMRDTLPFRLIEPTLTRIIAKDLSPSLRSFTWACRFRLALPIYARLRNSPTIRSLAIMHGVLRIWELEKEAPPTCGLEHLDVQEPKLITDMFQSGSHTLSTIKSLSFSHSDVFAAIEPTLRFPALRKVHFTGAISTKEAHRLLRFFLDNPTIEELWLLGYCPQLPLSCALSSILPNLTIIDERNDAFIAPSLLWYQPLRIFSSNTKVPASDLRRLNVTNLRILKITMDDAAFSTLLEKLSSTVDPFPLTIMDIRVEDASSSSKVCP